MYTCVERGRDAYCVHAALPLVCLFVSAGGAVHSFEHPNIVPGLSLLRNLNPTAPPPVRPCSAGDVLYSLGGAADDIYLLESGAGRCSLREGRLCAALRLSWPCTRSIFEACLPACHRLCPSLAHPPSAAPTLPLPVPQWCATSASRLARCTPAPHCTPTRRRRPANAPCGTGLARLSARWTSFCSGRAGERFCSGGRCGGGGKVLRRWIKEQMWCACVQPFATHHLAARSSCSAVPPQLWRLQARPGASAGPPLSPWPPRTLAPWCCCSKSCCGPPA